MKISPYQEVPISLAVLCLCFGLKIWYSANDSYETKIPATGNNLSPVDKSKLTKTVKTKTVKSDNNTAYVQRFAPVAQQEMKLYGIPASISLAQGILESRSGTSNLAVECNNHFGIKCFSKRCKAGHCENFTDDSHKDFFRNYKTPWQSWRDHSIFLSHGAYASLKGLDYRAYAEGLQRFKYATKPGYAGDLISIIRENGLNKFD